MGKLLVEREATWSWEIVGIFEDYDEIDEWILEEYGITFEEDSEEEDYDKEEWYKENGIQIREIPER